VLAAILLCITLGLDTLAVSVALGIAGLPRARWWKVGLSFALCEGSAPVLGMLLGGLVSHRFAALGGIVAGALLLAIGLSRMSSVLRHQEEISEQQAINQTHGWRLLVLGLSVSIDNLAIGFTLGALVSRTMQMVMIAQIPLQTLLLTAVGLRTGHLIGHRLGRSASLAAGIFLALIGGILLVQRLRGG
jgi:putative Mn2+ efflux pump MntP